MKKKLASIIYDSSLQSFGKDKHSSTRGDVKFPSVMSTCLDILNCIETFPRTGFLLEEISNEKKKGTESTVKGLAFDQRGSSSEESVFT